MSSRTAKIIVSILMLVSLLILTLSAAGLFGQDQIPGQTQKTDPDQPGTASGDNNQTSEPSSFSGTTAADPEPLTVTSVDPSPTPSLGMRRWPAISCLETIHQPDLASLTGRSYDEQPLAGITVILDPGHGGKDGGTSYPNTSSNPEIVEKNITLDVSLKTRDILLGMGAQVIMTRETDEWQSLYSRVALVGKYALSKFIQELPYQGYTSSAVDHLLPQLDEMITINNDSAESGGRGLMKGVGANADARLLLDIEHQYADTVFISLHCNALSDGSQSGGLLVYYQTNESNYEKETSYVRYQDSMSHPPAYMLYDDAGRQKLAESLRDSILKQIPNLKYPGSSDVLTGDYAFLRELNLVSALVEMGFVTSPADRQIMEDDAGRQKIAQGVADAVYAYYCQTAD